MAKSVIMSVNPEILKWLRESSGWKKEEVGKKLKISVTEVDKLEAGKSLPTLRQLRDLSKSFEYPLSSFFLSKPKKWKPLPEDFRFLQGKKNGEFNKKTIVRIRNSRNIQKISKELSLNIKYDIEPKVKRITQSDEPEKLASKYRKIFDLEWNKQKQIEHAFELFSYLRKQIEKQNVLVLQFPMPIDDARGFALTDEHPLVIVINSKDIVEAKLFSLMHEFGHVLLRNTVIDMPERPTQNKIETWCNNFASAFLLPSKHAIELFEENKINLQETKTLNNLSRKCKVSKYTLLIKMKTLKYITETEYKSIINRWKTTNDNSGNGWNRNKNKKREPVCRTRVGNKFVSLVARNLDAELITYSDALDYLSLKSKNLERVFMQGDK